MNIIIFGSCVTRDAFTFANESDSFNLIRYFARSSLATAFDSNEIEDNYTSALTSPFQKKIVGADFSKEFKKVISTQTFDYLILDLIDDRFDIFKFLSGEKVLLSDELKNTNFLKVNKDKGNTIEAWTDTWFEEWKKGFDEFIQVAKKYNFLSKIILNKVFWTSKVDEGKDIEIKNRIEKANIFLNKQYIVIEKAIQQYGSIIIHDKFIAKRQHTWGLSLFHYTDELYLNTISTLKSLYSIKEKEMNPATTISTEFSNFIYIKTPEVIGNQVFFSWTITYEANYMADNFFVDYYDIDISQVPIDIHYNTVIGLLLNKLKNLKTTNIIITEAPISTEIASFWLSYHDLKNTYFANLHNNTIIKSHFLKDESTIGILYGGGKDSYSALDIFSKNPEIKNIKLISFVIPAEHNNVEELEKRRDKLILNPILNKFNVDVIKIKTNARSAIPDYHLELYFAPLGVLAWLNCFDYLTFSYEFCHYYNSLDNKETFGFKRSQSNYIKAISSFYSTYISNRRLTIFNSNQHMTELSGFGYLAKSNPNFYKMLVMCESTTDINTKWCCSCTKCAEFVLFSMFYELDQNEIDIDEFFSYSGWVKKILDKIKNSPKRGAFFPGITSMLHFDSFKFVMTQLFKRNIQFNSVTAKQNFQRLIDYFSDHSVQSEDCFYPSVLKNIYPIELQDSTLSILINQKITVSDYPRKKHAGNQIMTFDINNEPNINYYTPDLSQNKFFSLLTNNQFSERKQVSNGLYTFIEMAEIITLGSLKNIEIIKNITTKAIDIYISKNPMYVNDGYDLHFTIPRKASQKALSFIIKVPHFSEELEKRFSLKLSINGQQVHIPLNKYKNVNVVYNLKNENIQDEIRIDYSLTALKNVEKWNWGKAARVIFTNFMLFSNIENLKNNMSTEILYIND
ncbi:DUF6270 domain-containing protein [Gallibacterium anatis]|uniref:DUF6270 domain-containing protein n=1 Tax=Gallibacterium anatis TaxID=750 RepID=UPI0026707F1B|nr:DUF6270 domain-containing protein [Gallibacterium anatis]WKS96252.1 DUF6270 domain-containing protein [Gallibacterium anatis]